MLEDKTKETESVRKGYNSISPAYDKFDCRVGGRVSHHIEWELLRPYLPEKARLKGMW